MNTKDHAREAVRLAARASMPARVRPEVAAFALVMESKLRAHDDRPGWKDDAPEPLRMRIYDEWLELTHALRAYPRDTPEYHSRILGEAADVANFAMMVADNWGNLLAAAPTPPDEASDALDAARYRKLRAQTWNMLGLCVVDQRGRDAVKLGTICPSGARLDAAVDAMPAAAAIE